MARSFTVPQPPVYHWIFRMCGRAGSMTAGIRPCQGCHLTGIEQRKKKRKKKLSRAMKGNCFYASLGIYDPATQTAVAIKQFIYKPKRQARLPIHVTSIPSEYMTSFRVQGLGYLSFRFFVWNGHRLTRTCRDR